MSVATPPRLGQGVYSFDEAAHIITSRHHYSARRVHWWLRTAETFGEHDDGTHGSFLSFADLVSLEVVARLRELGLSGQRIRSTERALRSEYPDLTQPFAAVGLFYTDGKAVWAATDPATDDLVEIVGRHPRHMVMGSMIRPFITEIHVTAGNPMAQRWDFSPYVEINPAIQFGRPVVAGTRVPVDTVISNLDAGTPEQVADWYGLSVEQVLGVQQFALAA